MVALSSHSLPQGAESEYYENFKIGGQGKRERDEEGGTEEWVKERAS